MSDEQAGTGDCFEVAAQLVCAMGAGGRAQVVHGFCVGRGGEAEGKTYPHAWVEVGDMVLDYSNGLRVAMPKTQYYALGQIGPVRAYSRFMVTELIKAYDHWGPWEPLPARKERN